MTETELAAFEVNIGNKTFRIFANGRIDGFENHLNEPVIVTNRIPPLLRAINQLNDPH